jgi:hypothetical protein
MMPNPREMTGWLFEVGSVIGRDYKMRRGKMLLLRSRRQ